MLALTKCGSVAGQTKDFYVFELPRHVKWEKHILATTVMQTLYDWDTLVLDEGARNLIAGGEASLCRNGLPCHLKVVGPGTLSPSSSSSLSCRVTDGCSGVELESLHVARERPVRGTDLLFNSGPPLKIFNCTLFGTSVKAEAAEVDVSYSSFVDYSFQLERGAGLSLSFSTFSGSSPVYLYLGSAATVESCIFENIHGVMSGGAIRVVGSKLAAINCVFKNCSSEESGGAIHGEPLAHPEGEARTTISISSSTFSGCAATTVGGAISTKASGTQLHVSSSTFTRCRSKNGGAIHTLSGSSITLSGSSFSECAATEDGGAVGVVDGSLFVLEYSTFRACTALGRAGAVFASGASARVFGCGFWGNSAGGLGGGAIYLSDIRNVVGRLECHQNTALLGGGGVLMWDGDFSTEIADGGSSICVNDSNNRAGYGSVIASSFKLLRISGVPSQQSPAFAGVSFSLLLSKSDHYGQTIASDSSSLVQAKTSLGGALSGDNAVQLLGTIISAFQSGTATFEFSVKPTFSLFDEVSGSTRLLRPVQLYFEGTNAEGGGQMLSDVASIPLSQNEAVCPPGKS